MLQMWFHVVRQGVETSVTQDTIGAVYINLDAKNGMVMMWALRCRETVVKLPHSFHSNFSPLLNRTRLTSWECIWSGLEFGGEVWSGLESGGEFWSGLESDGEDVTGTSESCGEDIICKDIRRSCVYLSIFLNICEILLTKQCCLGVQTRITQLDWQESLCIWCLHHKLRMRL